ncbi:MAG: hypothetical protein KAQ99_00025, partial [Candidatus Aureabacteria bacterium]|nr:hypothetical protein [Candidatus Auribacterota bacterium]
GQYVSLDFAEYASPAEKIIVDGKELDSDGAVLYDDVHMNIEAFVLPGWWRQETMRVEVIGGSTADNVVQLNIMKRLPDRDYWAQIIAMYSSGHLRLLPPAPIGEVFSCFGSSVLMGGVKAPWPSKEATASEIGINHAVEWPSCDIEKIVINPPEFYMDIYHRDGGSERAYWFAERGRAVLEVTNISYNTVENPFTVLRSMWVSDNRCVLSHVFTEDLPYPGHHIMREEEGFVENYRDPWVLEGNWWAFHRPNYCPYNTSNPDTRIEVISPLDYAPVIEAESYSSATGTIVTVPRISASGGATIDGEGNVIYDLNIDENIEDVVIKLRYSAVGTGAGGIDIFLDGVLVDIGTEPVFQLTENSDTYLMTRELYLTDLLSAGAHTLMFVLTAPAVNIEIDYFAIHTADEYIPMKDFIDFK